MENSYLFEGYVLWNPHTLLTIPHIFPIYLIRNVIFYWTTFLKCSYLTYHNSYLFETPNSYFFEHLSLYIHTLLNLVHTLLTTVHTFLTIIHTLLWYQKLIPYLPQFILFQPHPSVLAYSEIVIQMKMLERMYQGLNYFFQIIVLFF